MGFSHWVGEVIEKNIIKKYAEMIERLINICQEISRVLLLLLITHLSLSLSMNFLFIIMLSGVGTREQINIKRSHSSSIQDRESEGNIRHKIKKRLSAFRWRWQEPIKKEGERRKNKIKNVVKRLTLQRCVMSSFESKRALHVFFFIC